MKQALNNVIRREGIAIVAKPDALQQALLQEEYPVQKLYALLLILYACPSVREIIKTGQLSTNEASTLVNTAVRATGLTVGTVRELLSELVEACGIKYTREVEIPEFHKAVRGVELPKSDEDQQLDLIEKELVRGENDSSLTLGVLEKYAQSGSARACYMIGMYYHDSDIQNGTEIGIPYFKRAASLGYGAANGALADYYLNGRKKNLQTAANLFRHPSSIAGKSGRRWASNAEQLLVYRSENKQRAVWFLALCIAAVLISLAVLKLAESPLVLMALIVSVLVTMYVVVSMLFFQFNSYRFVNVVLMIVWLILIFSLA